MELPELYKEKMKEYLKEEYEDYIATLNAPSFSGLRVNTLKISVEEFLRIFPYELKQVPWCKNGFYYKKEDEVTKHPFYYAGLYYIQEPSAMLPAVVLNAKRGDVVLDACAAPGGKSLEIANQLKGSGLLFSNDISNSRAQALCRNIEKSGIRNACVTSENVSKLREHFPETFDRILVDAPCSGEGMFRKDHSLVQSWLERGSDYYSGIQKQIIADSYHLLKKGGRMVYSTCTFAREEDEDIIRYALEQFEDLHVVPIQGIDGLENSQSELLEGAIKLFPHRIEGEGHFVCLLEKGGKSEQKKETGMPSDKLGEEAASFLKHIKNREFLKGSYLWVKDALYLRADSSLDVKGIRTLRSGLLLGEKKGKQFEPSQHLALSLRAEDFDAVISFKEEDVRVEKYLKGETVFAESELQGWVLVCVEGYPLGFGKIRNGVIKNKIKAGSRKL